MNNQPNIQNFPATNPFWRAFQEWAEDLYERGGRTRQEVTELMNAHQDPNYRELEMRLYAILNSEETFMQKLKDIRDDAKRMEMRLVYGGDVESAEVLELLAKVHALDLDEVALLDSAQLSRIVYEAVHNAVETFEEQNIGPDLAYLLGAISKNGIVEWYRSSLPPLFDVLKERFPVKHPLWGYIAIVEDE